MEEVTISGKRYRSPLVILPPGYLLPQAGKPRLPGPSRRTMDPNSPMTPTRKSRVSLSVGGDESPHAQRILAELAAAEAELDQVRKLALSRVDGGEE